MAEVRGQLLETARPLSESIIWRAQNHYYEGAGRDAWASGDVPYTLTTGPILARAYARLIEAFARDCLAGAMGVIDPSAPLYVVELGAGTGRLAFEILRALDRAVLGPLRLRYVLTDRVAENVAGFADHEVLAPFIAAGEADVAHYVAGLAEDLHLEGEGSVLEHSVNPLIVVANYLFDVIPQDLFSTEGGELNEELVTTCAEEPLPELGDHDFFRRIFLATSRRAVAADRYGGGAIDAALSECAAARPPGRFLFPADALRTLQHLLRVADGRLLCLIGERPGRVPLRTPEAAAVDEAIRADPEVRPGPAVIAAAGGEAHRPGALLAMGVHGGSMSLPVDLSILARVCLERSVLLPEAPPSVLLVSAMLFGEQLAARELRRTYQRVVVEVGPEDVYLLVKAALGEGEHEHSLGHAQHLAVLRAGGYDPYLFRISLEGFPHEESEVDDAQLEEIARVLERTYEHDFAVDDSDLAYGIAATLAPIGGYAAALQYFARSSLRTGPRANTSYNCALCELHLGRVEEAIASLEQAIALDRDYEPARALLAQVLDERARDEALARGEVR